MNKFKITDEITKAWLEKKMAWEEMVVWFLAQEETDAVKLIKKLIAEKKLDWANWLIAILFNRKQRIQYTVFAAESIQHLIIDENIKKRAQNCIDAAKSVIENDTAENRKAAANAEAAAWSDYDDAANNITWIAARAAYAASKAAYATRAMAAAVAAASHAANVAWSAFRAAYVASKAANADAHAAYNPDAAANAEDAARDTTMLKILKYGLTLLKESEI